MGLGVDVLSQYFEQLNTLRSQKEVGSSFNFQGAVYSIIPKTGETPRTLVHALTEAKENGSMVIAAWVGQYRTDMFLVDDIDLVIAQLSAFIE